MSKNRTRQYRVSVRLNQEEFVHLINCVAKSGINREAYLRTLIMGNVPTEKPSEDFLEVINQLRRIGTNINQITVIAHQTGAVDYATLSQEIQLINDNILEIRRKVYLPTKVTNDGNNSDMGC